MMKTISITVSGNVQGVFYRQSTKEKATSLGLAGEVRNLKDGRVHIIATGEIEKLNQLVEWCKKGPPRAKVTGVEVFNIELKSFGHFSIIR